MTRASDEAFELSKPGMRFSFEVPTYLSSKPEIIGNQRKFSVEYAVPAGKEFEALLPENVKMDMSIFHQYFSVGKYDRLLKLTQAYDKAAGLIIVDLDPISPTSVAQEESIQYLDLKNPRLARMLKVRCPVDPVDLRKGVRGYFARFSVGKVLVPDLVPNELLGFSLQRITLRLTEKDWKRVNKARENLSRREDYKPEGLVRFTFEPTVRTGDEQSLDRKIEVGEKFAPEEVLDYISIPVKLYNQYRSPESAKEADLRLNRLKESSRFAVRRIAHRRIRIDRKIESSSPGWRDLASVASRYRDDLKDIKRLK